MEDRIACHKKGINYFNLQNFIMRSTYNLNKLIAVFAIIFFIILTSCHHHYVPGSDTRSDTRTPQVIHIIDGDTTSGTLALEDVNGNAADTFKVFAGQTVKWLLGRNQVIAKILTIAQNDTSKSIFPEGTREVSGSLNWECKIDPEAGGRIVKYNIEWTDSKGRSHTFDPFIRVNPGGR